MPGRFPLTQLASEQTRLANRIHKILEDANIKLGAVASDILGKSGRAMLWALIGGQRDPDKLADLAEGRLRAKILELKLAMEGHFTEHHQFLMEHLLRHLDELKRQTDEISQRIAERLRPLLDNARLERLDAIEGEKNGKKVSRTNAIKLSVSPQLLCTCDQFRWGLSCLV